MGIQNCLAYRAGLEQGEAQQHRVPCALPDGGVKVGPAPDLSHQHRVNCHTNHNKKALQPQGHKTAQIVLPHLPPFPVGHGGEGDSPHGAVDINFDHAANEHQHDAQGQDGHGDFQQHGFHQQAEQFPDAHGVQLGGHVPQRCGEVHAGAAGDDARAALDHRLAHLEDGHGDVKGVGHQIDGHKGLDDPLIDDEGLKIQRVLSSRFFK